MLRRCGWRDWKDALLLHIFTRALAEFANKQPTGEVGARSATKNAGGGRISRWKVGVDVGGGKAAARGRHELGPAAVSGHEPAFGSERSGMNALAKNFGSPSGEPSTTRSMLQQMCEKLWTLPFGSFIAVSRSRVGQRVY